MAALAVRPSASALQPVITAAAPGVVVAVVAAAVVPPVEVAAVAVAIPRTLVGIRIGSRIGSRIGIVFLPHSFDNYDSTYVTSPGRGNIPACIPPGPPPLKKKIIDATLEDLNKNFLAGRDREPNLSRSANRPAMYSAIRTGAVESVVFVGSSNTNQLAFAAATLGVDTYKHAQGGWKVTIDCIYKLILDLKNTLSSVPPDTPVIFFCRDNSSFMGLKDDGNMAVIIKCVEGEDGFHVVGELVVAPERALGHVHI
jgi:hypothetical protein